MRFFVLINYLSIVCILQNYVNLSAPSKVDAKEALRKLNPLKMICYTQKKTFQMNQYAQFN